MKKDELVHYILENDPFFRDAQLYKYSYYELMIIRVSIEVEKIKEDRLPEALLKERETTDRLSLLQAD